MRNVLVTDAAEGFTLYSNPMTGEDTLAAFGAQVNLAPVCLNGGKRDRLVWRGDFYHTARIIGVGSSRFDLSRGTLDFILETQVDDGSFNTAAVMSYNLRDQTPLLSPGGTLALADYQILGIVGLQ